MNLLWHARPISELSRAELEAAFAELFKMYLGQLTKEANALRGEPERAERFKGRTAKTRQETER